MQENPIIQPSVYFALVFVMFIFPIIGMGIDYFFYNEQITALESIFQNDPQFWEAIVALIYMVIYVVLFFGLLTRKEWGRKLHLYGVLPSYTIYLLPSAFWIFNSGLANIFYALATLATGALLLIVWLPQLYTPIFAYRNQQ